MARAKRTGRADARHRYRAATTGAPEVDATIESPIVPVAALPRERRDRRPSGLAPGAPPPPRKGFLGSMRSAAGPADIRGDLRAFPSVLIRSKATLIPGLVIVVTTAAMLMPVTAANQIVVLAGNVILQPPPMIIAFLAGMLAPRGAWLMGGLAGLAAGVAYVLVVTANTDVLMTPLGFTYVVSTEQKLAYAQNVLITAPVFGIAIGAFAGFYRRFLSMSSPQRQAARRR
ncbi:MAG: hypothetical protein ABIG85_00135 [Chloroflexota bacterium]